MARGRRIAPCVKSMADNYRPSLGGKWIGDTLKSIFDPDPAPNAPAQPTAPAPSAPEQNPFDKFKPSVSTAGDENPFDRFVGAAPATGQIDFNAPVATVRDRIARLPSAQRDQALSDWADAYVKKERSSGGLALRAQDTVRNLARGVPIIGGFADEGSAALASLTGTPYDEALAYQRATDRASDRESPKLGKLPESVPFIGGHDVTTADLTKLTGGLLSAPLAPVPGSILGMAKGAALLPTMVRSAVAGGGYAAGHGFAEGEGGFSNRMDNAVRSAPYGFGLGAAAPALARGAANAYGAARDAATSVPTALRPSPSEPTFSKPAVQKLSELADNSGLLDHPTAGTPPEAMLMNLDTSEHGVGPLGAAAARIARNNGQGGVDIKAAITDQLRGAPARIEADLDATVGRATSIPDAEAAIDQHYRQQNKPLYDAYRNTKIDLDANPQLGPILDKAEALGAFPKANKLMAGEGFKFDANNPQHVPQALDYVKQALDDTAREAGRGTNGARIASSAARELRDEVDSILVKQGDVAKDATGTPIKNPNGDPISVYEHARNQAREGFGVEKGLELGTNALKPSLSPDQLTAQLFGARAYSPGAARAGIVPFKPISQTTRTGGMGPEATEGLKLGMGDAIRQKLGDARSVEQGFRSMNGPGNIAQKIETVYGPQAAQRLQARDAAEASYRQVNNLANQNSATSTMDAMKDLFPAAKANSTALGNSISHVNAAGMALEGTRRVVNMLTSGRLNERIIAEQRDAARMLVANGADRDTFVRGLRQYRDRADTTQVQRNAIERIISNVLRTAGIQNNARR